VNIESVKVNIEGEDIYVYPDIVVTHKGHDTKLPYKDYIIYKPLLIAEVLSDSARKYDLTDKLIQYQKISSLQYYLAIEPLKKVVIFYEKDGIGNWSAKTYTENDETITFLKLDISIKLGEIYAG